MQRELRGALLCLPLVLSACFGGNGNDAKVDATAAGNLPPSIAGVPPAIAVVGEFYRFTPEARDPEGEALTFSIRSRPPWATFNTRDGTLSGTPGPGDIGSHVEIEISASDGQSTATIAAFSINVVGSGDGSATLSWYPPTENDDGSVLTDLAGYRIYYGRRKHSLDHAVVLDNPGLTRYVVEGLTPAKWYFAMTSVNRDGVESPASRVVSKKVG